MRCCSFGPDSLRAVEGSHQKEHLRENLAEESLSCLNGNVSHAIFKSVELNLGYYLKRLTGLVL